MKKPDDDKILIQYIERLSGALLVGLDWELALVAVNVPIDLIDAIENNTEVKNLRARVQAEMEYDLLKLHSTARKIAASKGQGRPIEWMLGQINPNKYAKTSGGEPTVPSVVKDDL